MIQIETKCLLCDETSLQPLDVLPGFGGGETPAMLDGLDLGHRWRGMKLCPGCGACAPDLSRPVPGLGARTIRLRMASAAFRDALATRAALPGRPDTARPDAMRWLAYATAFAADLPPEAAGRAWAYAAAELELPRLRPPGAEWADPPPRPDLAAAARREAARCLDRVFRADFPVSGVVPAGLTRMLRRRLLGEAAREPSRLLPDGAGVHAWRRDCGRFDTACLLAELHRRLGEFGAAQGVAAHALRDGMAMPAHVAALRRQSWLALSGDATPHKLRRDIVPAPIPAPARTRQPEPALLAA